MVRGHYAWMFCLAGLCSGCHWFHAPAHVAGCAEGEVIRVKAPPQRVLVELPEGSERPDCSMPPSAERKDGKPESGKGQPESAKKQPEAAPRPREREMAQPESLVGAAATVANVAQMVQQLQTTTASLQSFTKVNTGGGGLGISVGWIEVPIPFPRLFRVREEASITLPLSQANIIPLAGQQQMTQQIPVAAQSQQQGPSREELVAAIVQELRQKQRADAPRAPAVSDADRQKLERQLSDAERQIERLTTIIEGLDSRLGGWKEKKNEPLK